MPAPVRWCDVRAIAFAAALAVVTSCVATPAATPTSLPPTVTPAGTAVGSSAGPSSSSGLDAAPTATVIAGRRWLTVPDGLSQERAVVAVEMAPEAIAGQPRARLRSTGETVPLQLTVRAGAQWAGSVGLAGVAPGEQTVDFLVRLRDGTDRIVATKTFLLSQPVYVVWTLDFEGDAATNETMDNAYAINRTYFVPMTIMWNPRVWTTTDVSAGRAEVMRQWTMNIANAGHGEVALHLHAWTDFVRAAGVTPRTAPSWAGRSDGYDVPLTAFDESETRRLLDHALRLMAEHGMPRPTTFRAGGLFANAANLRAVAAAGFNVDTSATPAGGFGRLVLPWTLRKDAQPYRPSSNDANAPGDLPLLEVPNIAGNTYALDTRTIRPVIDADLAMVGPAGQIATARKTLTLVSHPGTIDATERAAIEALFKSFDPYRYDRDNGPVRFVTLAQLEKAFK
jgi:hypothetical protein